MVTKYDRRGYRPRRRPLIVTTHAVYILNEKDFRLKRKIPFSNVTSSFLLVFSVISWPMSDVVWTWDWTVLPADQCMGLLPADTGHLVISHLVTWAIGHLCGRLFVLWVVERIFIRNTVCVFVCRCVCEFLERWVLSSAHWHWGQLWQGMTHSYVRTDRWTGKKGKKPGTWYSAA